MMLKSVKYSEFETKPNAWTLDAFTLQNVNLIVGKNASGKTRLLNLIASLSNLISSGNKLGYVSGNYQLVFQKDKSRIEYELAYEENKVYRESYTVDGKSLLNRGEGGEGLIFAQELDQDIKFQVPQNELACVARRDSVQHPFFEDLYQWSKSSYHYQFGGQLGKDHYASFVTGQKESDINLKETDKVVYFLKKGKSLYGETFAQSIKQDMFSLGYELEDVGVGVPPNIVTAGLLVPSPEGIYVREVGVLSEVYQHEISQGMFRALSLIIQLNLAEEQGNTSSILVDDIGEGLDFERASSLIKLVISKAVKSSTQLIMSSNDRFVMNNVPLEYWHVIQRVGSRCRIFNYQNSKAVFEEFKFTGLANFDFLSTEFYRSS